MTARIVAERPTARYCEKHGTMIVECLFRSDKLQHDWVLSICQDCHNEAVAADKQASDE